MSVLTSYITRQLLTPFLIAAFTLSGLVWLMRALRELDRVVLSGQSLGVWLELALYTMPRVLETTLPPSFLIAVFYAFYRLFMDSEIIVMFAAGVARTRLIRPVFLFSVLVMAFFLACSFLAIPWGFQAAKVRSLQINANIANAMLQPGIFTNPSKGVTAFVRSRDEKGFLYGLFFQDGRDAQKPVSYTAESGALVYEKGQATLLMFNGHIQHLDKTAPNAGITLVKFDRYSYDLSQLARINPSSSFRAREHYPLELYALWTDDKTPEAKKKDIYLFSNNIFLRAFYIIAYGFIALAVFLPAQINRQGYRGRILVSLLAAIALSFSHMPLLNDGFTNERIFAALYLNPLIAVAFALFICLRGVGFGARLKHRWATAAAAKTAPAAP